MDLSNYLNEEFDDRSVAPATGSLDPVPPGEYILQLEKGEVAYTSTGTGVLFKARFAILEGEYSGRAIFANYNVRNNNQQAQLIGIAEMKAFAMAIGVDWEDARKETDLLLYKPFLARVGMERESINKNTGQAYPPRNKVLRYMPATFKPQAPPLDKEPAARVIPAGDNDAPF